MRISQSSYPIRTLFELAVRPNEKIGHSGRTLTFVDSHHRSARWARWARHLGGHVQSSNPGSWTGRSHLAHLAGRNLFHSTGPSPHPRVPSHILLGVTSISHLCYCLRSCPHGLVEKWKGGHPQTHHHPCDDFECVRHSRSESVGSVSKDRRICF